MEEREGWAPEGFQGTSSIIPWASLCLSPPAHPILLASFSLTIPPFSQALGRTRENITVSTCLEKTLHCVTAEAWGLRRWSGPRWTGCWWPMTGSV